MIKFPKQSRGKIKNDPDRGILRWLKIYKQKPQLST